MVNPRNQTKYKLFQERTSISVTCLCELCGKRIATDMHEILNRVYYPTKFINDVPSALLSALCNDCNVNHANQIWARWLLLNKNCKRYGIDSVKQAIETFAALTESFTPERVFPELYEAQNYD